jgi:signal-transduction protein with cAMP-binding, CBS, and nucleotidyltransferase domain
VAANLMREAGTGFLPVLEKFSRRLVGVVTDHDLCLTVLAERRNPAQVVVGECMTPDPVFCDPNDDVCTALGMMRNHGVRRLPVVNKNWALEGVVSIEDLFCDTNIDAQEVKEALSKIRKRGGRADGECRVASRHTSAKVRWFSQAIHHDRLCRRTSHDAGLGHTAPAFR